MKRAIDVISVDTGDAEDKWAPFTLEVCAPGKLRMIVTAAKAAGSIIQTDLGRAKEPELVPVPALVFEIDPEGEKQKRSYLWLAMGVKITYPGNLEYRGHYIDPETGGPMFLYEAFPEKKG